jgi:hypothetical protein
MVQALQAMSLTNSNQGGIMRMTTQLRDAAKSLVTDRITTILSKGHFTTCQHCGVQFIPFTHLVDCPKCGHALNSIDELEIDDSFGELDIDDQFGL